MLSRNSPSARAGDERWKPESQPRLEADVSRDVPLVRSAILADVSALSELANSLALDELESGTDLSQTGFLVSGFTAEAYADFVGRADHFLVLKERGRIVSFLLAYSSEHIHDETEALNAHIRDTICHEFVLVKQICTARGSGGRGHAQSLYAELYARLLHAHPSKPRPVFTVIVAEPPNPKSVRFHERAGFALEARREAPDGRPRLIYANRSVRDSLDVLKAALSPASRALRAPICSAAALADPDCVGVGVVLYALEPPSPSGAFFAHVRVMLKWRRPGLEREVPRHPDAVRTPLELGGPIRAPRFALNELQVERTEQYAYMDRTDPPDVVTMQLVLRGTFKVGLDLRNFPADCQMLPFRLRMWDAHPDDRRRYFRQLPFVDGTPFTLGTKGAVETMECTFLAIEPRVGIDETAGTSFYEARVPCVRKTWYFLRTVAWPLVLISALAFTSVEIPLDDFSARAQHNAGLLLTAVAFLFIAKEGLPRTAYMTQLDRLTNVAFAMMWAMMVLQFITARLLMSDTADFVCACVLTALMLGYLVTKIAVLMWDHDRHLRRRTVLGTSEG